MKPQNLLTRLQNYFETHEPYSASWDVPGQCNDCGVNLYEGDLHKDSCEYYSLWKELQSIKKLTIELGPNPERWE